MPAHPVSVRLEDGVQDTLETAARARGIGLSTYLRELASAEAMRLRKARIREQSRQVADAVAADPEAARFHDDWGTPSAEGLDR
jgi:hypothetical protein